MVITILCKFSYSLAWPPVLPRQRGWIAAIVIPRAVYVSSFRWYRDNLINDLYATDNKKLYYRYCSRKK